MAKCEKLLEKARASAANFPFKDLRKLMECYGYEPRKPGNHSWTFNSPLDGSVAAVQPAKGKGKGKDKGEAKPYQVRQVLAVIDQVAELRGSGEEGA